MSDSTAAPAASPVAADATNQPQVPIVPKAPEVPKPDDKFAAKFAALTRKERELREREGKSKVEIEAVKKQSEEYKTKYGKYENLEGKLKSDKREGIKFLMEQGYTPDEIADLVLEEMNPDAEKKMARQTSEVEKRLMDRLSELENKLTQKEKDEVEALKKAEHDNFNKTVTQVKTELKEFIDATDDFELIKLSGEYETVFDVMQEHYNDQLAKGVSPDKIKLLSYEEAAKFTETYLEEDARTKYEAKRAKKQAPTNEPGSEKKTSPTLSNTLSTEVQSSAEDKPRTREESLVRAARLLRYQEE